MATAADAVGRRQRPGCNGAMALSIAQGQQEQDAAWKLIDFISSEQQLDQYAQGRLADLKKSYDTPSSCRARRRRSRRRPSSSTT